MKPQSKLNGILRGTRQARTQEPGLQHFSIVEKPVIVERASAKVKNDWVFHTVVTVIPIALIAGLIAVLKLVWG